jgi:hypothetical protein
MGPFFATEAPRGVAEKRNGFDDLWWPGPPGQGVPG